MKMILVFLILIFQFSSFGLAEGIYTVIIKKQEEKARNRWSLLDWLATRKTIALQDQWLALNSSTNWMEFYLGYSRSNFDNLLNLQTEKISNDSYTSALYIKFFGLELNKNIFSDSYKSSDLKLNMILWGSSLQSTHLRGFYGQRNFSMSDYSNYDQNLFGGNLTFYLATFLGLEGSYSKFLKVKSENGLYKTYGERIEYGLFAEFYFIKIFYKLYSERNIVIGNETYTNSTQDGHILGTLLYF